MRPKIGLVEASVSTPLGRVGFSSYGLSRVQHNIVAVNSSCLVHVCYLLLMFGLTLICVVCVKFGVKGID